MKKFKKGLIIGPDGIGQAHIREFISYGINEISILRKNIYKNQKIINQRKSNKVKFNFLKSFNEIKKFRPEIISICSPHYLHIRHLSKISTLFPRPIIVEKPFLVSKDMNFEKLEKNSNNLYTKFSNKIFVNIPMIELVNQIKRIFKLKKIKQVKFKYLTKGKHKNEEILIDLLPHAISFVLSLQKKKDIKFDIKKLSLNKNKAKIFTTINEMNCQFYLEQNNNLKKSSLTFEINNKKYKRIILEKDKIQQNYILHNKKKYKIANPLTLSLRKLINSLNLNLDNKTNRLYVSLINKFSCHVVKKYRKNIK